MNLVRNVSDHANELLESQWDITPQEALDIAVRIQHNEVLMRAFGVWLEGTNPSFLEQIAMEMGASSGLSIRDAMYDIAQNLEK
jgi:hypothetical protein